MSEANKDKALHLIEAGFGQGKLEVVDEMLGPDLVSYDPDSGAGEVRGAENHQARDRMAQQRFRRLPQLVTPRQGPTCAACPPSRKE